MLSRALTLISLSFAAVSYGASSYALTANEVLRLDQLCGERPHCQDLVLIARSLPKAEQSMPQGEQYSFEWQGTTYLTQTSMVEAVGLNSSSQFRESGDIRFQVKGFYRQPNGQAVGQSRYYSGRCPERRVRNFTKRGFSSITLESAYEFDAQGRRINAVRGEGGQRPTMPEEELLSYTACYLAFDLPLIHHVLATGQMPADPNPFGVRRHPSDPPELPSWMRVRPW